MNVASIPGWSAKDSPQWYYYQSIDSMDFPVRSFVISDDKYLSNVGLQNPSSARNGKEYPSDCPFAVANGCSKLPH
jgi:hypothetical protein